MAAPLVLIMARITWAGLAAALRRAPAAALNLAKRGATVTAVKILAGVTAAKAVWQDEFKEAKKLIYDQTRATLVKMAAKKAFGDLSDAELAELETEVRDSKLAFTSAVTFAINKFAQDGFEAAMNAAEQAVDNADLDGLQRLSTEFGITPPTELSQSTRDQLKTAIRSSFRRVRDEGRVALRRESLAAKEKLAAFEKVQLERIAKAKAALKEEAQKAAGEAVEAAKLLSTGLTADSIKALRGRSTTQIQAMLANMREGDNQTTRWTKTQLEGAHLDTAPD